MAEDRLCEDRLRLWTGSAEETPEASMHIPLVKSVNVLGYL